MDDGRTERVVVTGRTNNRDDAERRVGTASWWWIVPWMRLIDGELKREEGEGGTSSTAGVERIDRKSVV